MIHRAYVSNVGSFLLNKEETPMANNILTAKAVPFTDSPHYK